MVVRRPPDHACDAPPIGPPPPGWHARAGGEGGRSRPAGGKKTWRASIASPPFHPPTHLTDHPARATGTRNVHGLCPTVWRAGRRRTRWSRTGPWLRGKAGGRRGRRKKKKGRAVSERRRRPRQFRPHAKAPKAPCSRAPARLDSPPGQAAAIELPQLGSAAARKGELPRQASSDGGGPRPGPRPENRNTAQGAHSPGGTRAKAAAPAPPLRLHPGPTPHHAMLKVTQNSICQASDAIGRGTRGGPAQPRRVARDRRMSERERVFHLAAAAAHPTHSQPSLSHAPGS